MKRRAPLTIIEENGSTTVKPRFLFTSGIYSVYERPTGINSDDDKRLAPAHQYSVNYDPESMYLVYYNAPLLRGFVGLKLDLFKHFTRCVSNEHKLRKALRNEERSGFTDSLGSRFQNAMKMSEERSAEAHNQAKFSQWAITNLCKKVML